MKTICFAVLALWAVSTVPAHAWNGMDADTGTTVRIESLDSVRLGSIIEIYDLSSGRYHDVDVDSLTRTEDTIRLQVYDYDTSRNRTLEMQIGSKSQPNDLVGF